MPRRLVLVAIAFLSGAAMLVIEMSAARVLAPYFGTSVYVWTNIIATILAALALGYWLGGLAAERGAGARTVALVLGLSGLGACAVPLLAGPVAGAILPASLTESSIRTLVLSGSLLSTLVLFTPGMVLLGAVSPMLVRLLAAEIGVGRAAGAVSAAGTAGALAGTYATTLWLVPIIGTRWTLVTGGLLLFASAAGALLVEGLHLRALGTAGAAALIALAGGPGPLSAPSRGTVVASLETPYQYARVERQGRATLLFLNEAREAAQTVRLEETSLTGYIFDYMVVLPSLTGRAPEDPCRVALLGLAGGGMSRVYHDFWSRGEGMEIWGVEIDPGILALGREWFEMNPQRQPRLRQVEADARVFLERAQQPFDVIILDCFSTGVFIPFHLVTSEFFTIARERLSSGGVLSVNVIAQAPRSRLLADIEATIASVFGSVYRFRVPGTWNFLLVARAGGAPPDVASARTWLERLEGGGTAGTLSNPGGSHGRDAALLAARLGGALDRMIRVPVSPDSEILTDDLAPVERLAQSEIGAAGAR